MDTEFFFCLLAQISLTLLLVDSLAFSWFRFIAEMIDETITDNLVFGGKKVDCEFFTKLTTCYVCTGFWIGVICGMSVVNGLVVSMFSNIIGSSLSYLKILDKTARENL